MLDSAREKIENLLYPELRPFGRAKRDHLLREARGTSFDTLEWIGILGAMVLVVVWTRYDAADFVATDRFAAGAANFLIAGLLLGVTAGPFLVRRTRRGLRSLLR